MSPWATPEARVSVTVWPETATPPEAMLRRDPFTVTRKAPGAGTESPSKFSVKVMVSAVPSTAAPWNPGSPASTLWARLWAIQEKLRLAVCRGQAWKELMVLPLRSMGFRATAMPAVETSVPATV